MRTIFVIIFPIWLAGCSLKDETVVEPCEHGSLNSSFEFSRPLTDTEWRSVLDLLETEINSGLLDSAGIKSGAPAGGQATGFQSAPDCPALHSRIESAVPGLTVTGECVCEASRTFD